MVGSRGIPGLRRVKGHAKAEGVDDTRGRREKRTRRDSIGGIEWRGIGTIMK